MKKDNKKKISMDIDNLDVPAYIKKIMKEANDAGAQIQLTNYDASTNEETIVYDTLIDDDVSDEDVNDIIEDELRKEIEEELAEATTEEEALRIRKKIIQNIMETSLHTLQRYNDLLCVGGGIFSVPIYINRGDVTRKGKTTIALQTVIAGNELIMRNSDVILADIKNCLNVASDDRNGKHAR